MRNQNSNNNAVQGNHEDNTVTSFSRNQPNMKNTTPLRFGSGQKSEFFMKEKKEAEAKESADKKDQPHPPSKRARQNLLNEFWRLYNAYNELEGSAHVKFDDALKNLYAALNSLNLGIKDNNKGNRISGKMDELLHAYLCSCEDSDTSSDDKCDCLEDDLHKVVEQIEHLEEESLEHTKIALRKLEEANDLHNVLNELKVKLEHKCLPK